MAKGMKTLFKDPIVPTSSGKAELEFEGGPVLASGDFEVNGQRPVILLGESELSSFLKEIE